MVEWKELKPARASDRALEVSTIILPPLALFILSHGERECLCLPGLMAGGMIWCLVVHAAFQEGRMSLRKRE